MLLLKKTKQFSLDMFIVVRVLGVRNIEQALNQLQYRRSIPPVHLACQDRK